MSDAEAWLAAIVNSADDAIVSKTLQGIITSWNPGAERMFGWTAAEAVGRHITLIIPPERHAEAADILARVGRGEIVDHLETVRVTKDGRPVSIALTVSPIVDAGGRVIGAAKIARDVGERRHADEARARLAAIVDSSDDVIVSKTLGGIITSWNPAAERMFGWTAAEAVGRHITLIIPRERWPEADDVLARIARGDRVEHFETVRVTKTGEQVEVALTVSPVKDASGRIIGASKIARDVTERRRLEKEREELLRREQAARAEAEATSRAKDEFLATVSHELRTPLSAVFGWARMLQSARMDAPSRQRAVDAIVRSSSAQARLIDDLLDVSRLVMGQMRLDPVPVELRPVVEAALDTARPAAAAKAIDLTADLEPAELIVLGAPERLRQVVWNLLVNAVKFTPRHGRIGVVLRRRARNAEIVVSDSGEGISAGTLPHVFEQFRQEDGSTTRAHAGLGLGLTLVRRLVDLHGGEVTAESAGKGRGATFTVRLPLAVCAE